MKKIYDKKVSVDFLIGQSSTAKKFTSADNMTMHAFTKITGWNNKKRIGCMRDEVINSGATNVEEFIKYYTIKHPDTYGKSVDMLYASMQSEDSHVDKNYFTKEFVAEWVYELMFDKTFTGFTNEKNVVNFLSSLLCKDAKISSSEDDSHGIDAYIGGKSVQVKPISYNGTRNDSFVFYDVKEGTIKFSSKYFEK